MCVSTSQRIKYVFIGIVYILSTLKIYIHTSTVEKLQTNPGITCGVCGDILI